MSYTIYDKDDNLIGGDTVLDDMVRAAADDVAGYVTDADGKVVHDARGLAADATPKED